MVKFILSHNDIKWYLNTKMGKIVGVDASNFNMYEFWIGNPPIPNTQDHALFVAVCDFAVAQGMLRRIYCYAVV